MKSNQQKRAQRSEPRLPALVWGYQPAVVYDSAGGSARSCVVCAQFPKLFLLNRSQNDLFTSPVHSLSPVVAEEVDLILTQTDENAQNVHAHETYRYIHNVQVLFLGIQALITPITSHKWWIFVVVISWFTCLAAGRGDVCAGAALFY